jgi:hypothetical protein
LREQQWRDKAEKKQLEGRKLRSPGEDDYQLFWAKIPGLTKLPAPAFLTKSKWNFGLATYRSSDYYPNSRLAFNFARARHSYA